MKKILAISLILSLLLCMAACGKETTEVPGEEIDAIVASSEPLTEDKVRSCLMLSNEAWWCLGDFGADGTDVTVNVSGAYYISKVDEAPLDISSVAVREVKIGYNTFVPMQTGSSEKAAEMLKDFGYGDVEYMILEGDPQVVFYFEGEVTGPYNEHYMSIDVPLEISCDVILENGEMTTVTFRDEYISAGSGGYIELDESSFEPYQFVSADASSETADEAA